MDIDILDEHIIICGWNDDIFDVITTLLASTERSILIISERIEHNPTILGYFTDGKSFQQSHLGTRAHTACIFQHYFIRTLR